MENPNKRTTLSGLAEDGEVLLEDLPDNPESNTPKGRRGLPSQGTTANAAANALHCGGMSGFG